MEHIINPNSTNSNPKCHHKNRNLIKQNTQNHQGYKHRRAKSEKSINQKFDVFKYHQIKYQQN